MLRYGANTNWAKFKERMSLVMMEKYGDLARFIEIGEYWAPPTVEIADYDLDNDPHGLHIADLKEDRKLRKQAISKMETNAAPLYAFICLCTPEFRITG